MTVACWSRYRAMAVAEETARQSMAEETAELQVPLQEVVSVAPPTDTRLEAPVATAACLFLPVSSKAAIGR